MRRFAASFLSVALGVCAAVALVSCGGGSNGGLLPGNTAREITKNLDAVAELSSSGDCSGAQDEAQLVGEQIDALGGVDKQLKRALRDGARRLNEVVATCSTTATQSIPTVPVTTESTTSEKPKKEKGPKKGETTPTTPTTPTVTTPTQTTPTTPTSPPGPPDGGGGVGPPSGGVGPSDGGGGG